MPLSDLYAEHRSLEAEAAHLLRIVAAPTPDSAAVAALRWRMRQALRDHCTREDRTIYQWLIASGDEAGGAAAREHQSAHDGIGHAFARYLARWPVTRIAHEWDDFRAETEDLVGGLAAHIRLDEQHIYPHAERLHARHQPA